jgi:hypothetical protein
MRGQWIIVLLPLLFNIWIIIGFCKISSNNNNNGIGYNSNNNSNCYAVCHIRPAKQAVPLFECLAGIYHIT